jgi:copper chaperone CopZ
MRRIWMMAIAAVALTVGCYRQDVRAVVVKVPQMKSADCEKLVQESLRSTEGIKAVVIREDHRSVEVTYEALKLGIKNIEHSIAAAGFDANDTPGLVEARAKLPEGCR